MAATYTVKYGVGADGAGVTWTVLPGGGGTSFRFKTNTDTAEDLNDPIPIPSSGINYSFWVSVVLELGGTYAQVDNIRHYSDATIGWTLGTAGGLFINDDASPSGLTDTDYDQSAGTAGTTGYNAIIAAPNGHGDVASMADIETFTAGSPQLIDSTAYISPTETTLHLVMQVRVDEAANGAVQGLQSPETLTFLADEI